MSMTPIYEEVRRTLGRPHRAPRRRTLGGDDVGDVADEGRDTRPVMLRAHGGRHRRTGD